MLIPSPKNAVEFQPTRPRGARLVVVLHNTLQGRFNPRAHEGRDIATTTRPSTLARFNPRAHEGRDKVLRASLAGMLDVSTHAPTRGATLFASSADRATSFNPRAHEGRDFLFRLSTRCLTCFNPRAHEGRDLKC